MMQSNFNLTAYQEDIKSTRLNFGGNKSYCLFDGDETLVMASSFDAYTSGSDDGGDWRQYYLHGCVGKGTSSSLDYLEGFMRNNPTKIYQSNYAEVEISPEWYATSDFDQYNYADLNWMLIFPSPICSYGIPTITVTEKDSKHEIRLYNGKHEYPKVYKGSKLLWDANDENLDFTTKINLMQSSPMILCNIAQ